MSLKTCLALIMVVPEVTSKMAFLSFAWLGVCVFFDNAISPVL
jgi:hypothetical protein